MTALYFAYGSNMSSARLRGRIAGVRVVSAARLDGFELVFDKPGQDGSAKANLRATPNACAHGVLWQVELGVLETLDGFEPGYERILQPVSTPTVQVAHAWTYLHPGSPELMQPNLDYVQHLIEGAREHALPAGLLSRLERLAGALA